MPYSVVSVSLTDGQVKKLKSKSAKECGTTITLKPSQMTGGTHKISLTDRQIKHFNDALKNKKGVQIDFSKAAIANMIKSGGIFPLFAAIPGIIAAAAPAAAKAVALGAVGALGSKAVQSIAQSYEPKKGRGYSKLREIIKMANEIPAMSAAMGAAVMKKAMADNARKATGRGYIKKGNGLRLPGTPWYRGRSVHGSGLRIPGTVY